MNEILSNIISIATALAFVGFIILVTAYFVIKVMNSVPSHKIGGGISNRYKDLLSLCTGIYGLMALLIFGVFINPIESVDPKGKYVIVTQYFELGSKASITLLVFLVFFPLPLLGYSVEELSGRFRALAGPRAELRDFRHVVFRYLHDCFEYRNDVYVRSLYRVKIGVTIWITITIIMYFRLIGKMA